MRVRDVILAGGDTGGYGGVSEALTRAQDAWERGAEDTKAAYGRELRDEIARRRVEKEAAARAKVTGRALGEGTRADKGEAMEVLIDRGVRELVEAGQTEERARQLLRPRA